MRWWMSLKRPAPYYSGPDEIHGGSHKSKHESLILGAISRRSLLLIAKALELALVSPTAAISNEEMKIRAAIEDGWIYRGQGHVTQNRSMPRSTGSDEFHPTRPDNRGHGPQRDRRTRERDLHSLDSSRRSASFRPTRRRVAPLRLYFWPGTSRSRGTGSRGGRRPFACAERAGRRTPRASRPHLSSSIASGSSVLAIARLSADAASTAPPSSTARTTTRTAKRRISTSASHASTAWTPSSPWRAIASRKSIRSIGGASAAPINACWRSSSSVDIHPGSRRLCVGGSTRQRKSPIGA